MASVQRSASSGSDGGDPSLATVDERKRKRMLSNRESARRSRMKKQKQMEDLTNETSRLQMANSQLVQSISAKEQAFVAIESANNIIRAQVMELTDRLRSLNSVLQIIEEVSGFSVDIPEIPDPLMNTWQLHHQMQPIVASADLFLS